jgi:uncharacterized protein involved in type VI secretion and phage assembly
MHRGELFEIPLPGLFHAAYLAIVVEVKDPAGRAQVKVRLLACDGVSDQDGPIWARVAVPFAGSKRGAFLIPDVDDEVLVVFVNGDPRYPVVVGGLWNGADKPPETLGGDGSRVDRWTLVGKAGTRIAIVEESSGTATIKLSTPSGVTGQLTDESGGKVELVAQGSKITIDGSGVTIDTPSAVTVKATSMAVTSGSITVQCAQTTFSGDIQCQTLTAVSVTSGSYSVGIGNVW